MPSRSRSFIGVSLADCPGVTEAGLPELNVARFGAGCQQRVPEHIHSQVKMECDMTPRYDALREIDRDPTAIFWDSSEAQT
jgi:hypothetical protein